MLVLETNRDGDLNQRCTERYGRILAIQRKEVHVFLENGTLALRRLPGAEVFSIWISDSLIEMCTIISASTHGNNI